MLNYTNKIVINVIKDNMRRCIHNNNWMIASNWASIIMQIVRNKLQTCIQIYRNTRDVLARTMSWEVKLQAGTLKWRLMRREVWLQEDV